MMMKVDEPKVKESNFETNEMMKNIKQTRRKLSRFSTKREITNIVDPRKIPMLRRNVLSNVEIRTCGCHEPCQLSYEE